MTVEKAPFATWAIVEIMGHQQFAGQVTEEPIAGQNMLRVDIPAVCGRPEHTKYFGGASIYAIHPCTEDIATSAAERLTQAWGASLIPVAVPDVTNALETIRKAERIAAQPALTAGVGGSYTHDDFEDDLPI